jgi:UDP-N-acetylglucosamine transferase subunit ALG13
MILVVVGSSTIPFDRLLRAVETLPGEEPVLVQRGASAVAPARGTCVEFLPFEELQAQIREARVVVTHAGVGTILVSLMSGKRPVVVPRLERFGEAVDDHQLELARQLAEEGLVDLVLDPADLAEAVERAVGTGDGRAVGGSGPLVRELRAHIAAHVGVPPRGAVAEPVAR